MKKITAEDFEKAIMLDPAWASKLNEPVEITTFCEITSSDISHLSPHLHFTGKNCCGMVAEFWFCQNLKVVQGTFHGGVSFSQAGIERIDYESFAVTECRGVAATTFSSCFDLKVAEGTFAGPVYFSSCGIERIDPKKLIITPTGEKGMVAIFDECPRLKVVEGKFPGSVVFDHCNIERLGMLEVETDVRGQTASFINCPSLSLRTSPMETLQSLAQGEVTGIDVQAEIDRRIMMEFIKSTPDVEI